MPPLLMLKALPWKLIGWAALGLLIVSMFVAIKIERAQSAKLKSQLVACADARQADRRSYESAQREAEALNKAQVAKVEAEQERVNNEISSDLNARLERLRRELHSKTAAAKGVAGRSGSSADGSAARSAPDAAGLHLTPEQLLRAAENEERHDQLISWIEKQLQISR